MPTHSTTGSRKTAVSRIFPYDDRSELHKLLTVCELKCSDAPEEVRRLLHDLTSRIELTGDSLLQTKLLILKAQTDLELGETRSMASHLRAAMLALNSVGAVSDLKTEILADLEEMNAPEHDPWEAFRRSFDKQYPHFMLTLMAMSPALTPLELKICAMIKASIPSKEMPELIKTSLRGIENHRYHIRQKLGLEPKENLNAYLLCI